MTVPDASRARRELKIQPRAREARELCTAALLLALALCGSLACGSDGKGGVAVPEETGGASNAGGAGGTGVATGGTGGVSNTGGADAAGGAENSGGMPAAGGAESSGGAGSGGDAPVDQTGAFGRATVSGATVAKSSNFQGIFTLGESPGTAGVSKSGSTKVRTGVVGATQP
jgi:hypothetical protein